MLLFQVSVLVNTIIIVWNMSYLKRSNMEKKPK